MFGAKKLNQFKFPFDSPSFSACRNLRNLRFFLVFFYSLIFYFFFQSDFFACLPQECRSEWCNGNLAGVSDSRFNPFTYIFEFFAHLVSLILGPRPRASLQQYKCVDRVFITTELCVLDRFNLWKFSFSLKDDIPPAICSFCISFIHYLSICSSIYYHFCPHIIRKGKSYFSWAMHDPHMPLHKFVTAKCWKYNWHNYSLGKARM